jgi:hypothetical protein
MVKATTTKVSLIVAALALAMALGAAASLGLSPAHAIPQCDVPNPPPICSGDEEPPQQSKPPKNDAFSGAFTLPVPGTVTGTTSKATMEPGEPAPYSPTKDCGIFGVSKSVWYKVTLPYTGPGWETYITLSTKGSSFDTVLALYQGSSVTSLQQVACSNNNSQPNYTDWLGTWLKGGQTYYLQLSGTGGARSGVFNVSAERGCSFHPPDQEICGIDEE